MRATVLTELGSAPQIRDLDMPQPAAREVRIRVYAASLNGFDLAVVNGLFHGMMEHRFPLVLGKDFAGTVDAVGPGVTDYSPGDRVFGVVTKDFLGDGSFAEYVAVPTAVGLAKLPDAIDFVDGAALGLASAAALACIDAADITTGQTVLVAGATGGVGNQAVQLAAQAGAHVIATAHTDDERKLVTELGAGVIVDYTQDVVAAIRSDHPSGVDVVLHLAGDLTNLLPAVRAGGRFVSTLIFSPEQVVAPDEITVVPIYTQPTRDVLERSADNHLQQRTRINIQRTYALDSVKTALTDFASGTLGKLVIRTAADSD